MSHILWCFVLLCLQPFKTENHSSLSGLKTGQIWPAGCSLPTAVCFIYNISFQLKSSKDYIALFSTNHSRKNHTSFLWLPSDRWSSLRRSENVRSQAWWPDLGSMTFCCFIKKKKVLILIYDSIFCMNCIHSVATTTDNRRYRSRKQNTSVFTRKTGNMGSVFLIQILSIKTKQIISAELITFLTAESEVELKSLLMRVKEESEKAGLKLNIKKN